MIRSAVRIGGREHQRVSAAGARAQQAAAWPNPQLSVAAENVGQSRAFTGIDGVDGLEAQAVVRDQMLVASAGEEAVALSGIADMLALQAERGRGSEGDAARSRLAAGLARTALARRESTLARVAADLSRRLGYDPATA